MNRKRLVGACALALGLVAAVASPASATTWHNEDMLTYTQLQWGDIPDGTNIASVLAQNYLSVYPSSVFAVGNPSGFTLFFGTATTLLNYLPAAGPPGPLNADLADPLSSASGDFGGNVAALKLNIDFTDAGLVHGSAATRFGDLTLYGLTTTPDLNNLTVRQALATLSSALAGLPTGDSFTDLDMVAIQLNGSFFMGSPSQFAQDHLQAPQARTSVPELGSGLLLLFGLGTLALSPSRRRLARLAGRVAWRNRRQK